MLSSSSWGGRGGEGRCRFVIVVIVVEPRFIDICCDVC